MSASAPAGSASSITGKLSAASTSATSDGDDESEVINQPEPTSCIHVPTFETIVAIHRLRKSPFCKGLHAEGGARTSARPALSVMRARSRFHRFPQRRVDRVEQRTQAKRNILDPAI